VSRAVPASQVESIMSQPTRTDESGEATTSEHDPIWDQLADLSHKINNPLTSLLGRAQLLRQRGNSDPYVARAAEVIEECSRRIANHLREISSLVKEHRGDDDRMVPRNDRSSR
jgi:signal transduction histidine kinase